MLSTPERQTQRRYGANKLSRSTSSLATVVAGARRVPALDRKGGGRRSTTSANTSELGNSGLQTPASRCTTPPKRNSRQKMPTTSIMVQETAIMQELETLRVTRRTNADLDVDVYPRRGSVVPELSGGHLVLDADAKSRKQWSWVEGPTFSGIMIVLLLLNSLALAMETDHASWPWWLCVNGAFLVIYIVEFVFRAMYRGKDILSLHARRPWDLYDFACVVLGTLDILAASLIAEDLQTPQLDLLVEPPGEGVHAAGTQRVLPPEPTAGTMLLRGLMLTRLMRIVRILRMHGPLNSYVKLLLSMMKTFVWILSIMFVLGFVTAIVLTSLVAHGLLIHSEALEDAEQGIAYFADIPTSLFTIFQLTTAEDWSKIQNSVLKVAPVLRGFFVCFIVFMSWTMLSLLTAVASETMISASSSKKEQEAIDQEIQRHSFSSFLCQEFVKADTDGNRVLDKEEFAHLMTQPQMMQTMKAHGIYLQDSDLMRTWDTFDIDESGELTIDELVTGFSYMQENLAMKHVANVCYSLKHFGVKMETNIDILQTGADELARRQRHTAKMVKNNINWQLKRWQLFCSGDMEDLLVPSSNNSETAFSEKDSASRFGSFKAKVSTKIQCFGGKNRAANTLTVPRMSRSSSSLRSQTSLASST